jgi:hypothetical protein
MYSDTGLGGFFFGGFPAIFSIMFVLVFGVIIFIIIKGLSQWNKNNNSPVLTVDARLVAKRTNVSHYHNNTGNEAMNTSTSTTYYATFEVESGDRMELQVSGYDYGMMAEGDQGRLTFHGTRFKSFERM